MKLPREEIPIPWWIIFGIIFFGLLLLVTIHWYENSLEVTPEPAVDYFRGTNKVIWCPEYAIISDSAGVRHYIDLGFVSDGTIIWEPTRLRKDLVTDAVQE